MRAPARWLSALGVGVWGAVEQKTGIGRASSGASSVFPTPSYAVHCGCSRCTGWPVRLAR